MVPAQILLIILLAILVMVLLPTAPLMIEAVAVAAGMVEVPMAIVTVEEALLSFGAILMQVMFLLVIHLLLQ